MDVSHLASWVLELSLGSPEGQQVPCGLHVIRNQPLLPQRMDGGTIDPSLAVSPDKRLDIWLEEGSNHMAHLETNEEQALGARAQFQSQREQQSSTRTGYLSALCSVEEVLVSLAPAILFPETSIYLG